MGSEQFTVSDVLAWARTKPADEAYNYLDPDNCAVAQFGRETGRPELVGLLSASIDKACPGLQRLVHPCFGEPTFGALVTRLEALVQETPAKPSPWLNPQTYIDCDCGEQVK